MKLEPAAMIKLGREWIERNPDSWAYLKTAVEADAARGYPQPFRLSHYVEQMRGNGLKFCNAAAPYIVRRLERETGARFKTNHSKIDYLMMERS